MVYNIYDLLSLSICAVISGCEGWEYIRDFAQVRLPWLNSLGLFKKDIPVDDTIARLISRLDPEQLQKCFIKWMRQANKLTCGEVVAIDGETVRSSYNREDKMSAIHMVRAFATANGVVMSQMKTDEKSNEITAIPALLKMLDIRGCLITIDAMGCQKGIANTILTKGADYLLPLKTNQELLHRAVVSAFREAKLTAQTQIEKGHGRIEAREYYVLDAVDIARAFPQWKGLQTIGMAINYQNDGESESVHYRYYVSSAELTAEQFGALGYRIQTAFGSGYRDERRCVSGLQRKWSGKPCAVKALSEKCDSGR